MSLTQDRHIETKKAAAQDMYLALENLMDVVFFAIDTERMSPETRRLVIQARKALLKARGHLCE